MYSDQQPKPTWRVFLPGLGGWFFLFLLAGFLFARPQMLLWDGGTCRHLSTGTYILTNLKVPGTNYVSALFADVPWLTNSLLCDLLLGGCWLLSGLNGVVLLCSVAIALGLTWGYQLGRQRGLGPLSSLLWLVPAVAACSVHWSARPHVLSYLPFLVLYYLTFIAQIPALKRLLLTCLTMLLWANLHGSFMLGLVLLGIKICGDALESGWRGGANLAVSLRWPLATLAASLVATFINLRGPGFIPYVAGYLLHPMVLLRTDEFRSIDFALGFQIWSFIALGCVCFCLWIVSPARPKISDLLLMLFLFFSGIYSMRMIPYFVLLSGALMGPAWNEFRTMVQRKGNAAASPGWLKHAAERLFAAEGRLELQEPAMLSLSAPMLVIAGIMSAAFLTLPAMRIADFDEHRMPVKAVDYISANGLQGLGFVYDNWGGYLYWRLKRPIFIDDWTNFYPLSFLNEYVSTIGAQGDWQSILDKYNCQYALLPADSLLGQAMMSSGKWKKAYEDAASRLYVRAAATGNVGAGTMQ